jgi:hypothetical protein
VSHGDPEIAEIKQLVLQLQGSVDALSKRVKKLAPKEGSKTARPQREAPPAHSKRPDGEPLLVFIHIPKTGGGTLKGIFAGAYSKRGVVNAGNYPRNQARTDRELAHKSQTESRVLIGHVPLSVFRRHAPAGTAYLTLLRDPVERVLSHYYRHAHRPDANAHSPTTPGGGRRLSAKSLEQALEEQRVPELRNLATRFLCDAERPLDELPESALEEAKRNLEGFAFVGLQERFDESSVMLARQFGFTLQGHEHRHVSKERPTTASVSAGDRELIESNNALDIELYRWAAERFERSLSEDPEIEGEVRRLRADGTLRTPVRPV